MGVPILGSAFVSAVVYTSAVTNTSGIESLDNLLSELFAHHEIICVFDGAAANSHSPIKGSQESYAGAFTVIYMGVPQGLEKAMNAGIDCAVGDFVLEIDDLSSFDPSFLQRAYALCEAGADVVFGTLGKRTAAGSLFYPLFNRFSATPTELTSTVCSLVSRRAINRTHQMSEFMPWRKAAYAACGLKVGRVQVDARRTRGSGLGMAVDALALYSDAFYKISFGFAALMSIVSLAELVYVVAVFAAGIPIAGWTSTALIITFGFLGLFVILTFVLKYLSLLLINQTNRQGYLVERIEKL